MGQGFFVTGTDTGVGKTLIACALLRGLAKSGKSATGMKPIAAGRQGGRWADVEALDKASTVRAESSLVNLYRFEPAIAPHIAAEDAAIQIEIEVIVKAFKELSHRAEFVIVEGIGGFMVPLNARETSAELAMRLGLPVVLVVGMRLGCLNHALLTQRQIAACGLRCAGWVANCILPDMPQLDANIRALVTRLGCPLLGVVPFQQIPDSAATGGLLALDRLMGAEA